jgi:hypothetical protein
MSVLRLFRETLGLPAATSRLVLREEAPKPTVAAVTALVQKKAHAAVGTKPDAVAVDTSDYADFPEDTKSFAVTARYKVAPGCVLGLTYHYRSYGSDPLGELDSAWLSSDKLPASAVPKVTALLAKAGVKPSQPPKAGRDFEHNVRGAAGQDFARRVVGAL